jgi:hypothetical protein
VILKITSPLFWKGKKPYNFFHFAKSILLNILAGVSDKYLKFLADRILKSLLPVIEAAKRCILGMARDQVACGCSLPCLGLVSCHIIILYHVVTCFLHY